MGSFGSHPHLSHLYFKASSGRLAPHSEQNFPVLMAPQEQVQPILAVSGFGFPHSRQNCPKFSVPQAQIQEDAPGFGLPQSLQNFPVFSAPQEHFQPPVGGVGGVGCCCVPIP